MSRLVALALLAILSHVAPAAAEYPERQITMIVPFAAGGPTDTIARIVGEYMQKSLGQPIIVENVAGAGGTTGITRGAQAKPDGYTIMMGHMRTHGAAPALYPNLLYDPAKDFAPVGMVAGTPIVIIAKKAFAAANLQEFVDYVCALCGIGLRQEFPVTASIRDVDERPPPRLLSHSAERQDRCFPLSDAPPVLGCSRPAWAAAAKPASMSRAPPARRCSLCWRPP